MTTRECQRRAKERGRYGRYDTEPGTKPAPRPDPAPEPFDKCGKFDSGRIVRARLAVEAALAQQRRRSPTYGRPTERQAPRR